MGAVRPPAQSALAAAKRREEQGFDAIWWADHFLHWFPTSIRTPMETNARVTVPESVAPNVRTSKRNRAGVEKGSPLGQMALRAIVRTVAGSNTWSDGWVPGAGAW